MSNPSVSFPNEPEVVDIEEATPATGHDGMERQASLEKVKQRKSMSQSMKAWDIDGDGELDEAELALREMDRSHKGTLTKEQMYILMSQNLQTQRDLFKVKKIVFGLVGFTCLLALSNLGTSLAAAFLAKDTTTNNSNLVAKSNPDRALATQQAANTFTVDLEDDEQYSRRMLSCVASTDCARVKGNGSCAEYYEVCTTSAFINLDRTEALALIAQCQAGNAIKLKREYQSVDGDSDNDATAWPICPASGSESYVHNGMNGPNRVYTQVTLTYTNGDTLVIGPGNDASVYKVTVGASNASTLVNPVGGRCDTEADCSGDNLCTQPNGDASDTTCSVPNVSIGGAMGGDFPLEP